MATTTKRKEAILLSDQDFNTFSNPFDQFENWFEFIQGFEQEKQHTDSISTDIQPYIMTVATYNKETGFPNARNVLLKSFDKEGQKFVFFTNYESKKGNEIFSNDNKIALLFYWQSDLGGMQVRIQGIATKEDERKSDTYFKSRPVGSQIGATISKQSQILSSKQDLLDQFQTMMQSSQSNSIERPTNWGGVCIAPKRFEFWHSGQYRLADRIVYEWDSEHNSWNKYRVYP